MNSLRKNIRLLVAAIWSALTNGYLYGFTKGKIYTGKTKGICVPGLNCYSCPGALGACPVGSLQAVMGDASFKMSCYVLGLLMLFGSVFGRFVCGWLCPFGLVQDLVYKIPVTKKFKVKNLPGHRSLIYLKYVVLVLFVFLLPSVVINKSGMGSPWFCEYICPSGTLFGGIPLVLLNRELAHSIGWRFGWKVFILLLVFVTDLFIYRPFCKYLCPLGAFYSFFNQFSFYHYSIDENKCIGCDVCVRACKMDINIRRNPNSPECIRCGECKNACTRDAIVTCYGYKGSKDTGFNEKKKQEK